MCGTKVIGVLEMRRASPAGVPDWAAATGCLARAAAVRLDCIEGNGRLRRYYLDLGFREVGRRDFDRPFFSAVLLESTLAEEVSR